MPKPGISQEDLSHLGEKSWETQFAVIQGDDLVNSLFTKLYDGYVDGPPESAGEFNSYFVQCMCHDLLLIYLRVVSVQVHGFMIRMDMSTFGKISPT
jgi:hypothetical protein